MTTITINERTKAGKTLLELANLLAVNNKGVSIDDGVSKSKIDKSQYNPNFVKMVLSSAKSEKRTRVTAKNLWQNI